eukprot:g8062.t1
MIADTDFAIGFGEHLDQPSMAVAAPPSPGKRRAPREHGKKSHGDTYFASVRDHEKSMADFMPGIHSTRGQRGNRPRAEGEAMDASSVVKSAREDQQPNLELDIESGAENSNAEETGANDGRSGARDEKKNSAQSSGAALDSALKRGQKQESVLGADAAYQERSTAPSRTFTNTPLRASAAMSAHHNSTKPTTPKPRPVRFCVDYYLHESGLGDEFLRQQDLQHLCGRIFSLTGSSASTRAAKASARRLVSLLQTRATVLAEAVSVFRQGAEVGPENGSGSEQEGSPFTTAAGLQLRASRFSRVTEYMQMDAVVAQLEEDLRVAAAFNLGATNLSDASEDTDGLGEGEVAAEQQQRELAERVFDNLQRFPSIDALNASSARALDFLDRALKEVIHVGVRLAEDKLSASNAASEKLEEILRLRDLANVLAFVKPVVGECLTSREEAGEAVGGEQREELRVSSALGGGGRNSNSTRPSRLSPFKEKLSPFKGQGPGLSSSKLSTLATRLSSTSGRGQRGTSMSKSGSSQTTQAGGIVGVGGGGLGEGNVERTLRRVLQEHDADRALQSHMAEMQSHVEAAEDPREAEAEERTTLGIAARTSAAAQEPPAEAGTGSPARFFSGVSNAFSSSFSARLFSAADADQNDLVAGKSPNSNASSLVVLGKPMLASFGSQRSASREEQGPRSASKVLVAEGEAGQPSKLSSAPTQGVQVGDEVGPESAARSRATDRAGTTYLSCFCEGCCSVVDPATASAQQRDKNFEGINVGLLRDLSTKRRKNVQTAGISVGTPAAAKPLKSIFYNDGGAPSYLGDTYTDAQEVQSNGTDVDHIARVVQVNKRHMQAAETMHLLAETMKMGARGEQVAPFSYAHESVPAEDSDLEGVLSSPYFFPPKLVQGGSSSPRGGADAAVRPRHTLLRQADCGRQPCGSATQVGAVAGSAGEAGAVAAVGCKAGTTAASEQPSLSASREPLHPATPGRAATVSGDVGPRPRSPAPPTRATVEVLFASSAPEHHHAHGPTDATAPEATKQSFLQVKPPMTPLDTVTAAAQLHTQTVLTPPRTVPLSSPAPGPEGEAAPTNPSNISDFAQPGEQPSDPIAEFWIQEFWAGKRPALHGLRPESKTPTYSAGAFPLPVVAHGQEPDGQVGFGAVSSLQKAGAGGLHPKRSPRSAASIANVLSRSAPHVGTGTGSPERATKGGSRGDSRIRSTAASSALEDMILPPRSEQNLNNADRHPSTAKRLSVRAEARKASEITEGLKKSPLSDSRHSMETVVGTEDGNRERDRIARAEKDAAQVRAASMERELFKVSEKGKLHDRHTKASLQRHVTAGGASSTRADAPSILVTTHTHTLALTDMGADILTPHSHGRGTVRARLRTPRYMRMRIHIRTHIRTHIRIHIRTHMRLHTRLHTRIHMRLHMRIHTTRTPRSSIVLEGEAADLVFEVEEASVDVELVKQSKVPPFRAFFDPTEAGVNSDSDNISIGVSHGGVVPEEEGLTEQTDRLIQDVSPRTMDEEEDGHGRVDGTTNSEAVSSLDVRPEVEPAKEEGDEDVNERVQEQTSVVSSSAKTVELDDDGAGEVTAGMDALTTDQEVTVDEAGRVMLLD